MIVNESLCLVRFHHAGPEAVSGGYRIFTVVDRYRDGIRAPVVRPVGAFLRVIREGHPAAAFRREFLFDIFEQEATCGLPLQEPASRMILGKDTVLDVMMRREFPGNTVFKSVGRRPGHQITLLDHRDRRPQPRHVVMILVRVLPGLRKLLAEREAACAVVHAAPLKRYPVVLVFGDIEKTPAVGLGVEVHVLLIVVIDIRRRPLGRVDVRLRRVVRLDNVFS